MFVCIVTTTIEIDHAMLIHGQKRKSIHYMVCIYIYTHSLLYILRMCVCLCKYIVSYIEHCIIAFSVVYAVDTSCTMCTDLLYFQYVLACCVHT
jgi:hypothetical protein